jgi:hypothetical protein
MRSSVTNGSVEQIALPSRSLQLLDCIQQLRKFFASHVIPITMVAIIIEPFRKIGVDKGEWQFDLNGGAGELDGGIRKLGVGKRDSSIRKLDCGIGKLADGFNFLQNAGSSLNGAFDAFYEVFVGSVDFAIWEPSSLAHSGGEFRQWIFLTISFRRDGRLRCVCFVLCNIVGLLSVC